MERLTYLDEKYGCWSYRCASGDAARRLAHLENLQEQGRLIELPCKAGDVLFVIDQKSRSNGTLHKVIPCHTVAGVLSTGTVSNIINNKGIPIAELNDIGKTTFFTREEAKAALEKLKGEKHG